MVSQAAWSPARQPFTNSASDVCNLSGSVIKNEVIGRKVSENYVLSEIIPTHEPEVIGFIGLGRDRGRIVPDDRHRFRLVFVSCQPLEGTSRLVCRLDADYVPDVRFPRVPLAVVAESLASRPLRF